MAYTPDNNPYIPGDPYSYDLKWQVDNIKHLQTRFGVLDETLQEAIDQADRAEQEADRAAGRADFATEEADRASDEADRAIAEGHAEVLKAEGFATGTQEGIPVSSDSPYYQNNSEYFSQQAAGSASEAADYAEHIADPVSGLVSEWLEENITQPTTPAVDTSLLVSGAAADAKIVGDRLSVLDGENVFSAVYGGSENSGSAITSTSTVTGKYIEYNGTLGNFANSAITFYPAERNKAYLISGVSGLTLDLPIIAFNTDPAAVSGFVVIAGTGSAQTYKNYQIKYVPPTDGYIAIVNFSNFGNSVLSVYNIDPELDIKYANLSSEIKDNIIITADDNIAAAVSKPSTYIKEDDTIGYINNANFVVDYYPVRKNDTVIISGSVRVAGNAYPLAVFGTISNRYSDIIINGNTGSVLTAYREIFTAPDDGFIATQKLLEAGEGAFTVSHIKALGTNELVLQAFGDSITDNQYNTWAGHTTWLQYIKAVAARYYDLTLLNAAYGGAALTNQNQFSVVNRLPNMLNTNANVAVIWAGTNDWAGSLAEIGTINGSNTTIKGAVGEIIRYISTNAPNIMPIFITPIQRYNVPDAERPVNADGEPLNNLGLTLNDVCNAIEEAANFYGVPCLRMDKVAGFNRVNIRSYASDGLHPSTAEANTRIAALITDMIHRSQFN